MKVTLYPYWQQYFYESKPELCISHYDRRDFLPSDKYAARIFLDPIEVEIPDYETPSRSDITKELILGIRVEQGEHQAAITELEGKIQELLCVEYKED
jgi:hypothetical protein